MKFQSLLQMMSTRIAILAFALTAAVFAADPEQSKQTEGEAAMLEHFQKEARANFVTACVDVTREVARKRLTIYSVVYTKARTVTIEGYDVEVRYHADLAAEHSETSGAYHHHHNHLILNFAGAEYAAGRKQFALRLIRLLIEAQPEMWWSSPDHSPLTIKKILARLEKDDESMKQFLEEESREWKDRVRRFGP